MKSAQKLALIAFGLCGGMASLFGMQNESQNPVKEQKPVKKLTMNDLKEKLDVLIVGIITPQDILNKKKITVNDAYKIAFFKRDLEAMASKKPELGIDIFQIIDDTVMEAIEKKELKKIKIYCALNIQIAPKHIHKNLALADREDDCYTNKNSKTIWIIYKKKGEKLPNEREEINKLLVQKNIENRFGKYSRK